MSKIKCTILIETVSRHEYEVYLYISNPYTRKIDNTDISRYIKHHDYIEVCSGAIMCDKIEHFVIIEQEEI